MTINRLVRVGALIALGLPAAAQAEVAFDNAYLSSSYSLFAGYLVGERGDESLMQQISELGDLNLLQQKSYFSGANFAEGSSVASVAFNSARSGSASIVHYLAVSASPPIVASGALSTSFHYGFVVDRPSLISVSYNLLSTGINSFGNRPAFTYNISVDGGYIGPRTDAAGTADYRLETSGYYALTFSTDQNHVQTNGLAGDDPTLLSGSLSFNIVDLPPVPAVPEPGEWAMILIGAGVVTGRVSRLRKTNFRS